MPLCRDSAMNLWFFWCQNVRPPRLVSNAFFCTLLILSDNISGASDNEGYWYYPQYPILLPVIESNTD